MVAGDKNSKNKDESWGQGVVGDVLYRDGLTSRLLRIKKREREKKGDRIITKRCLEQVRGAIRVGQPRINPSRRNKWPVPK